VREFKILTNSLTQVVSTIVVGVAISTIVAIAIGRIILRSSDRAGQQSQQGSNKKQLKQKVPLNPCIKMKNIFTAYNTYRSDF
jgi:hypothetical protein